MSSLLVFNSGAGTFADHHLPLHVQYPVPNSLKCSSPSFTLRSVHGSLP